jgi:hypothetical protein
MIMEPWAATRWVPSRQAPATTARSEIIAYELVAFFFKVALEVVDFRQYARAFFETSVKYHSRAVSGWKLEVRSVFSNIATLLTYHRSSLR